MKREYQSPASVRLTGKDTEYGLIAAAVVVIGIGPVWIW